MKETEVSDSDAEDSMGTYHKYVDRSEKTATVQNVGTTMDLLEILAVDPAIDWEFGEVIYVRFTADGKVYGSDKEELISNMEIILGDEMADISPDFANRFSVTSVEP